MDSPHIIIVTGEASGDMHGANLARALRELQPKVRISAMGGGALADAGAKLVYNSSRLAVVGLIEVISHLPEIRTALTRMRHFLRDRRPDLLILIDYPDFNLLLAQTAKKLGIPILYYVSPQVWAWRQGRVKKIRRLVDKMAVILPFEQEFYRARGVAVEFVGHPLLDQLPGSPAQRCGPGEISNLSPCHDHAPQDARPTAADQPTIGLLPGSRRREIATLLPLFLAAARILTARLPVPPRFLLPLAPGLKRETLLAHGLAAATDLDIEITTGDRHQAMADCDAVMAASGTVTLELAILGVPMVVAYRLSPLTYLLGRWLINLPHATLVNLVADREVIPELLQNRATPENISRELLLLLQDQSRKEAMLEGLAEVRRRLGGPGASKRTAKLALSLLPAGEFDDRLRTGPRSPRNRLPM